MHDQLLLCAEKQQCAHAILYYEINQLELNMLGSYLMHCFCETELSF